MPSPPSESQTELKYQIPLRKNYEAILDVKSERYEVFGKLRNTSFLKFKKNKYLGDGLTRLPCGIIDKQITGIGGTTLELEAERNSIVVVPIKAIAYSKSLLSEDYLYVGSRMHDLSSPSIDDVKKYLQNNDIEYKKILVVADSLPKVMSAVLELGKLVEYHITIDEVDSFQGDSVYRDKMEICLDYYKMFPIPNRRLITATMMDFSDPALVDEQYTIISREEEKPRNIRLIHTNTLNPVVLREIANLHSESPGKKIVVAYNSIDDAIDIAYELQDRHKIPLSEMGILCSKSNRKKVGSLFKEIENDELPSKINFMTSAYYTGVDIKERFHCISISDATSTKSILSDLKLKQIQGRCRNTNGVYSETIIYRCSENVISTNISHEELIETANQFISGIRCFNKQFSLNPAIKEELRDLRTRIMKCSDVLGHKIVREDYSNQPVISYFNIDAILESIRVKTTVFRDKLQLQGILISNGHTIQNFEEIDIDLSRKERVSEIKKTEAVKDVIKNLNEITTWSAQSIFDLKKDCEFTLQEKLYDIALKLFPFLEKTDLVAKVDNFSKQRNLNSYNYFFKSLEFLRWPDTHPMKAATLHEFKINDVVDLDIVKNKMDRIVMQFNLEPFSSGEAAMKVFSSYFKITRTRPKGVTKRVHRILGTNPHNTKLKPVHPIDFSNVLLPYEEPKPAQESRIEYIDRELS